MWLRKSLMLLVGVLLSLGLYLAMPSFAPTMQAQAKGEIHHIRPNCKRCRRR